MTKTSKWGLTVWHGLTKTRLTSRSRSTKFDQILMLCTWWEQSCTRYCSWLAASVDVQAGRASVKWFWHTLTSFLQVVMINLIFFNPIYNTWWYKLTFSKTENLWQKRSILCVPIKNLSNNRPLEWQQSTWTIK